MLRLPVPGRERFQVSDDGQIKGPKGLRKPEYLCDGRAIITVRDLSKGGKNKKLSVNRLVYVAFHNLTLVQISSGRIVHLDSNNKNNNIDNLTLTNMVGQQKIVKVNGRMRYGIKNKITYDISQAIKNDYAKKTTKYGHDISYSKIGRKYGISQQAVEAIINGKSRTKDHLFLNQK